MLIFLKRSELGEHNVDLDKSFDIVAGPELMDFLQAGRLIDRGFIFEALKLAYNYDFFLNGLNRKEAKAAAQVECRVVGKLQDYVVRFGWKHAD